jgi:hypothetical protein
MYFFNSTEWSTSLFSFFIDDSLLNSLNSACTFSVSEDQNGSGYQKTGALMINEDSIQGIVMEQEELSDSDDDGDGSENVEFEREEMADSDDDQLPVTFLIHFISLFFLG